MFGGCEPAVVHRCWHLQANAAGQTGHREFGSNVDDLQALILCSKLSSLFSSIFFSFHFNLYSISSTNISLHFPYSHLTFTQLHQLKPPTSATAIMPSERTAEGTWRGACLRGRGQWRNQDRSCLQPEKLADEARMETKHETFCIVPHPTAEVGPRKQPVGVPASLLLTAHWSNHELMCLNRKKRDPWFKKKKKKDELAKRYCGGLIKIIKYKKSKNKTKKKLCRHI